MIQRNSTQRRGVFYLGEIVSDQQVIDAATVVTNEAVKGTVVSSGVGLFSWALGLDPVVLISIVAAIGGLVISFLGFLVTWYYKYKEDKRAAELHEIEKVKALEQCDVKQD